MKVLKSQIEHVIELAQEVEASDSEFRKLADQVCEAEDSDTALETALYHFNPENLIVSALSVVMEYTSPGGEPMVMMLCEKKYLVEAAMHSVILDYTMEDGQDEEHEPEPRSGPSN